MQVKSHHHLLVFFYLFTCMVACDRRECTNSNPIFDNYSPHTNEYKNELVKHLQLVDSTRLRYWFKQYEERDSQENLHFYVQGDGLCAQLVLTVKQWNKIEDIKKNKGVSYKGAEFKNLTFDISQDSTKTVFIYRNVLEIID